MANRSTHSSFCISHEMMTGAHIARSAIAALAFALIAGCRAVTVPPLIGSSSSLDGARQLVMVTTADWDSTTGVLRRFERGSNGEAWRAVGAPTAIVVGRT